MSSILRINANRANGAKSRGPVTPEGKEISAANSVHSTGPITPEGKARVSQNAIQHGLLAKAVVLPDECPETFQAAIAALQHELQPRTFIEHQLVEIMAVANWRRRRTWHIEAARYIDAINSQEAIADSSDSADPAGPPEAADENTSDLPSMRTALAFGNLGDTSSILRNLHRYEVRFSREFSRHLLLYETRRARADQNSDFAEQSEPNAG